MIYRRRMYDATRRRLEKIPALMLEGPRMVGKSTLLRGIAQLSDGAILDLDDPFVRDGAPFDTALFASARKPFFIDEYQKDPEILDHIKAVLNKDGSNGQFVLTGSARREALPPGLQALTGRLFIAPVLPLAQAELAGVAGNFVVSVFQDPAALVEPRTSATTREQYIEKALIGGFPRAVDSPDEETRRQWFDQYVRTSIMEDARDLRRFHRPHTLPRLLRRLAAQTGQMLNISQAARDAEIKVPTAHTHTRLLEAVFLLDMLPAWTKNDLGPVRKPKVYVVDSGVAGRLLRLSFDKLHSRDPLFSSQFGHLLETFVVGEIKKMASWLDESYRIGYWRGPDGGEVDLVVERINDGAVFGIEIKAGERVRQDYMSGLLRLREEAGSRFVAGILLNTGTRSYRFDDKIYVMPVDKLWQGEAVNDNASPISKPLQVEVPTPVQEFSLPESVRTAADQMLEMLKPGDSPYWEISLSPASRCHFDDFYSSEGVRGALLDTRLKYPRSDTFGLGLGEAQSIGECVALVNAGRGVLIHPGGWMTAIAVGVDADGKDFLGWGNAVLPDLIARHATLNQWPLELARFAYEIVLPNTSSDNLTYWSVGRRLQSGKPPLVLGDEDGTPSSLAPAVVDNPARKRMPFGEHWEVDAFRLKASFYEWFGIPSSGLPESGRGRITAADLETHR